VAADAETDNFEHTNFNKADRMVDQEIAVQRSLPRIVKFAKTLLGLTWMDDHSKQNSIAGSK
jgi:hypothetical protein